MHDDSRGPTVASVTDRADWTVTTHRWSIDVDAEHLAQVRRRADLYGAGGRRHMILEVLAYANDEAESIGRVGSVTVTAIDDWTVRVADDGRGTDTRLDGDGGIVRKPVMATKDVRFFDLPDGPLLPDGMPRRGMSTVAALCPLLIHENHRANGSWSQIYRHGIPDEELRAIPAAGATGTVVIFRPGSSLHGPDHLTEEDLQAFPWLRINSQVGDA